MIHNPPPSPSSRREAILRLATDALERRVRRRQLVQGGSVLAGALACAGGVAWLAMGPTPGSPFAAGPIVQTPEQAPTQHRSSSPSSPRVVVVFNPISPHANALAGYGLSASALQREPVTFHTLSDDDLLTALAGAGHQGAALAHAPTGARLLNVQLDPPQSSGSESGPVPGL